MECFKSNFECWFSQLKICFILLALSLRCLSFSKILFSLKYIFEAFLFALLVFSLYFVGLYFQIFLIPHKLWISIKNYIIFCQNLCSFFLEYFFECHQQKFEAIKNFWERVGTKIFLQKLLKNHHVLLSLKKT